MRHLVRDCGEMLALVLIMCKIISASTSTSSSRECRDRSGYHDVTTFQYVTCATCYGYLFPVGKELRAHMKWLVAFNGSIYPDYSMFVADISNSTAYMNICRTLDDDECERWTQCCEAASACCTQQLRQDVYTLKDKMMCPRTWDGYSCWEDTPEDTTVTLSCPSFIPHAIPSVHASKRCGRNGSWFRDPNTDLEWTNYTACLNMDHIKTGIFISVGCNLVSLILLVPSVIIFFVYRSLRMQHRIRLHINLFLSFCLSGLIFILWDILVYYDRLVSPATQSLMHSNTGGCKFLYVLTRYSRSTNFMWMFLEGFYLHRLIVNAFEPPRSLLPLYLLGWGVPWIPVTIYSILHAALDDLSCWVNPFGAYEWIIYIPNLIFLTMNLCFLINILRILLTQISVHPNEPSNYRRALKATFVLVPLFGIQLIFIIYRPPSTSAGAKEFEIVSYLITNLQGFFVALIFCFLNSEVVTHLRMTADRLRIVQYSREHKRSITLSTQVPWDSHRNSRTPSRGDSWREERALSSGRGSWRYSVDDSPHVLGDDLRKNGSAGPWGRSFSRSGSGKAGDPGSYIPMLAIDDQ